ncbi:MAG: hypothetical protein IT558_05205 [Alphaproteobacteria bacterium]|nr:hypothetical protein [Alphaproteobacteria bacterium]
MTVYALLYSKQHVKDTRWEARNTGGPCEQFALSASVTVDGKQIEYTKAVPLFDPACNDYMDRYPDAEFRGEIEGSVLSAVTERAPHIVEGVCLDKEGAKVIEAQNEVAYAVPKNVKHLFFDRAADQRELRAELQRDRQARASELDRGHYAGMYLFARLLGMDVSKYPVPEGLEEPRQVL